MKIAVFDPYLRKFTADMEAWWIAQGHEVKLDRYYDPRLVPWADMVWFETCDNNLKSAMNPSESLLADWLKDGITPVDMHDMDLTGKKIVVRPIDIEVWQGHHADAKLWDLVTDCIFIAPHIRDMMMLDSRPQESSMKIHTIPHSINLDRWTFKDREPGFNVAVVSELWETKGTDIIPQIAFKLKEIDPRYKISWLGKWSEYHWDRDWFLDFIERHQLPIEIVDWVESVDEFLEDKNYLLHASKKEAFSAATAEAMAKGIKPVLFQFLGYEPLWGQMPCWYSIDGAVEMITNKEYDSQSYRQFLVDHKYTTPQMMETIMEAISG